MTKGKIGIIGIMVGVILGAAVLTHAEPTKVSQVIYITKSKAGRSVKSVQGCRRLGQPDFYRACGRRC